MIIQSNYKFENLDIIQFDQIESTNTYAKKTDFIKDSLIIAKSQSKGKGQFNRHFYSPKNKGLYFSLVLHNRQLIGLLYTLIMSVAVSESIPNSKIKWPNDILINNKKVCGILSESVIQGKNHLKIIIGVGINLYESIIPESLEEIMTWAFDQKIDVEMFLTIILKRFYYLLTASDNEIISLYKKRCINLNQEIILNGTIYYVDDISETGGLVIRDQNGNSRIVFSKGEFENEF